MNGTKLNKSCRDAWIICTLFRVKSWGEEIISANKICLVPGFEDRFPLTHPFQRNALSKCEQATLFLAGPREPSLMYSFQYYLCGHQVRYEREKSVSSFFLLICCSFHICPSSLLHEPKMQLLIIWSPDTYKLQFEW